MRRIRTAVAVLSLGLAGCGGGGDGGGNAETSLCGPYPPQATSPYVLPFQVGQAYLVSQGNCSHGSHRVGSKAQYAYDFSMPIDTPVVASRDGTVVFVQEDFANGNGTEGQNNLIFVEHDDGTVAGYVHLKQDGALVAIGDDVRRGDVIGSSWQALHFQVTQCLQCETVAVTFLNTRPHPDGLVKGEIYTAESY
jgi:murein DD-endopeptidase MepM/ murein hydrolase activator NlpD